MHPVLVRVPLPFGHHFTLYSYGFLIGYGFLLALYVCRKRAVRMGLDPDGLVDVALATLVGGLVGARLFYILTYWDNFRGNLWEILRIDHGGLVFYGGLMGGAALLFTTVLWKGMPVRRTLDTLTSVVPLGHAFGRLGCFMNGCCFGKPTGSWVGVRFPSPPGLSIDPATPNPYATPVHPTQLYAVGYNLLIFAFLSFIYSKRRRNGDVAWSYGILYGTARFCQEFFRGDVPHVFAGLTMAQLICIPLVGLGATMMVRSLRLSREPLPEPWKPRETKEAAAGARAPEPAPEPSGRRNRRKRHR